MIEGRETSRTRDGLGGGNASQDGPGMSVIVALAPGRAFLDSIDGLPD